jgi:hypothetical protein
MGQRWRESNCSRECQLPWGCDANIEETEVRNGQIKYNHLWVERLQELRLCEPVLKKLVRRWSVGELTDWILGQSDRGPFSGLKRPTIYTFLNALKDNAPERGKKDRVPHALALTRLMNELLREIKANQKLIDAQVQTRDPIPDPQLSEQSQRLAKLTVVDRRLMIEAAQKYRILLRLASEEAKKNVTASILARRTSHT